MYYYKYPINYLPNEAGDTTAFAVKQLIRERNYLYQILNNIVAGKTSFMKAGVLVATTGNIALNGVQTIDGVTVEAGDRVLVWKQDNAKDNGVYIVQAQAWKRADDADDNADFADGYFTGVAKGTYAGQVFALNGAVEVGETPILFRNIIQGDKVTQEAINAQKGAEKAQQDALTAAAQAKASETNAEAAAGKAQTAANAAQASLTEAQAAQKDVTEQQKAVAKQAANVQAVEKRVVEQGQEATNALNKVLDRQRVLATQEADNDAKRQETERLLVEAQSVQTDTKQKVAQIKDLQKQAQQAATQAQTSAQQTADSEVKVARVRTAVEQTMESVNQTRDQINQQLNAANETNIKSLEIANAAEQTKTEVAELKEGAQAAQDGAQAAQAKAETAANTAKAQATAAQEQAQTATAKAQAAQTSLDGAKAAELAAKASAQAANTSANAAAQSEQGAMRTVAQVEQDAKVANAAKDAAQASAIDAKNYMNLAKVYGEKDLSAYATKTDLNTVADTKMDKVNAYTKTQADDTFANKNSLVGLATTSYVDGRFSHIVGNATAALDTLEEIGRALNDDKDFAGTVSKQLAQKADKATTENALMGKANAADVYTKIQADSKFQLKGSYALVSDVVTKANSADVYTKTEAAQLFADKAETQKKLAIKADNDKVYTKTQADGKFQLKGDYALVSDVSTKADKTNVYSKSEVDGKFNHLPFMYAYKTNTENGLNAINKRIDDLEAKPIDAYTKAQSEERYQPKGDYALHSELTPYITAQQASERYAPKDSTNSLLAQKANADDVYTKLQSNDLYQPKGDYVTTANANNKYQPKGRYVTLTYKDIGGGMVIARIDDKADWFMFEKPIAGYYSADQIDKKFQPKGNYVTVASAEEKYQPKGNYAVSTNVYTKTESDKRYQQKGAYLAKNDVYTSTNRIKLPNGAEIGVE